MGRCRLRDGQRVSQHEARRLFDLALARGLLHVEGSYNKNLYWREPTMEELAHRADVIPPEDEAGQQMEQQDMSDPKDPEGGDDDS